MCVSGETGGGDDDGLIPECAPFPEPDMTGSTFSCQGQGTGWFVTDINGISNPMTSCLAYDTIPVPENPTADDCGWRPLDVVTAAYDVPDAAACCEEEAEPTDIVDVCMSDCGYASVKVAAAAIRASAEALQVPDGAPEQPFNTARADLYAYANYIESPFVIKYIADKVSSSPSEVVSVALGSGVSNSLLLGHIKSATLYLSCDLDATAPYVLEASAGECSAPANIPVREAEQSSQGSIAGGSVVVSGPGVYATSEVSGASFEFREVLNRDGSVEFMLTSFNASLSEAGAGSFELREVEIALAAPASAMLEGELVTFAAGRSGAARWRMSSLVIAQLASFTLNCASLQWAWICVIVRAPTAAGCRAAGCFTPGSWWGTRSGPASSTLASSMSQTSRSRRRSRRAAAASKARAWSCASCSRQSICWPIRPSIF